MIDQSQVTIIIPHIFLSKETDFAVKECLTSLDETVPNIQKIVAINGLKFEDDFETIKFPNVKFIVLEDQGQCKATNAAVATINTPWIFITNNDMVYPPEWWERLWGWGHGIKDSKKMLCMSPKLIEPIDGAPTFEKYFCGGAGGDFDKQKWLNFAANSQHLPTTEKIRTGFNLPFLISKELWDLVGGYDINYDPWGSNGDSDLEYKIRLAGIQPYQNTNCIVYHFSQTSGTFHPDNQEYWQKNWDYFIEKWGFPRTDEGIWEANFKMPTKEEGRKFNPDWENTYV